MKSIKYNGGEIPFGLEVILFVVAIFIIWVLVGGAKKEPDPNQSLFIVPEENQVVPNYLTN